VKKPWKREEPVHEQLHREAEAEGAAVDVGEDDVIDRPSEPVSSMADAFAGSSGDRGGLAFAGVPRLRGDWDLVVTGEAPGLTGADELGFVAIEDGDIFMDSHLPAGDVTPLAEAIELQIPPPYRAYGVRREGNLWAVSARAIELARFQATGDDIELTVREGRRELLVDGLVSFGSVPELEEIGKEASEDFFARAVRVEDDLWEITVGSL
jgi:hypothetical protein